MSGKIKKEAKRGWKKARGAVKDVADAHLQVATLGLADGHEDLRDDVREGVGIYTGRQQSADERAAQSEAAALIAAEDEQERRARRRREAQLRGALLEQPTTFDLLGGSSSTLG